MPQPQAKMLSQHQKIYEHEHHEIDRMRGGSVAQLSYASTTNADSSQRYRGHQPENKEYVLPPVVTGSREEKGGASVGDGGLGLQTVEHDVYGACTHRKLYSPNCCP